ncbi:MAG: signal recognition particle-docking protein FtsY [Gemmatimonadetes bacterium]|nr:signal recognition particle-docking protein FtsY [Gemmatimonadota bacterium]
MRLFKTPLEKKKGLWRRIVDLGLTDVRALARGIDHASVEDLEQTLLAADFGVKTTLRLTDRAEEALRRGKAKGGEDLAAALKSEITEILGVAEDTELRLADSGPTVYLIVGVNGVGKTTSVAKVAHMFARDGRKVLMAAADTFRAGAVAQLEAWADRIGVDFLKGQQGGDPAAVAFDALEAAEARGIEVVLIDTAGRLHTNRSLMEELVKIDRVVRRRVPGAPHETLLVLDATVGQNAVRQLEAFRSAVGVTGIILAKLDSSSKGGIVVALREEYGVPVKLVGTGEGLDDLSAFDPNEFVEALFAPAV